MNDGHKLFSNVRITPFRDAGVVVTIFGEPSVAAPFICDDSGTWCHNTFDEAAKCIGAALRHNGKPNPSGIATIAVVIEGTISFAVAYFNGSGDDRLVVHASAFTACSTAHIGFVDLDVFIWFAPDLILIRAHHANTQFVKNLIGRLVPRKPELSLKLNGRDTRRLAGDQIGRPEPYRQRRVSTLHDGAGSEVAIDLALTTPKNSRAVGESIGLAGHCTARTNEPILPARTFKISRARSFVREQSLKFGKRARKWQITSLKYIDSHGRPTSTRIAELDDARLTTYLGPQARLIVIGAGDLSRFLCQMALALGFEVIVCDPREELRASWDLKGLLVSQEMPDDMILRLRPDARTAVVAVTHDPKLDGLALIDALQSEAFYVGAIGSRRNSVQRRTRLREHFDLPDAALEALHGPAGLYIGSKTPAEIALSIMAEVVAVKNGVDANAAVSVETGKAVRTWAS